MYKELKVEGYSFRVNEQGWATVVDNYDGRAIELSVSAMKKMIAAYEKEFNKENT